MPSLWASRDAPQRHARARVGRACGRPRRRPRAGCWRGICALSGRTRRRRRGARGWCAPAPAARGGAAARGRRGRCAGGRTAGPGDRRVHTEALRTPHKEYVLAPCAFLLPCCWTTGAASWGDAASQFLPDADCRRVCALSRDRYRCTPGPAHAVACAPTVRPRVRPRCGHAKSLSCSCRRSDSPVPAAAAPLRSGSVLGGLPFGPTVVELKDPDYQTTAINDGDFLTVSLASSG